MAYINVDVEIDLDKFSTEELFQELEHRLKLPAMEEYVNEKVIERLNGFDVGNLNILDESKLDYFFENFDKITEEQLKQIVEKQLKIKKKWQKQYLK